MLDAEGDMDLGGTALKTNADAICERVANRSVITAVRHRPDP